MQHIHSEQITREIKMTGANKEIHVVFLQQCSHGNRKTQVNNLILIGRSLKVARFDFVLRHKKSYRKIYITGK